jgi:hypothetical protein
MYLEILLGISQNESLLKPLSPKEMTQWASMVEDVKNIKAKGHDFYIPNEIP